MTLYWSDVSHKMSFIVPSGRLPDDITAQKSSEEENGLVDFETRSLAKSVETIEPHQDIKSLSSLSDDSTVNSSLSKNTSDTDSNVSNLRRSKQTSLYGNVTCDIKILIIWLESVEDAQNLPIRELYFKSQIF